MTTNRLEQTPVASPDDTAHPIGRVTLQIVGVLAIFAATYFATSTLLTDGYDATTTAVRLGVAAVSALLAAGALLWSKRLV